MKHDHHGAEGPWMSPDPYGGSYDIFNPQSMNRYSYVSNNPLVYVDPDGTTGCQDDDSCGDDCAVAECSISYPNGAPAPGVGSWYSDDQGGVYVLTGYDGGNGIFDYYPGFNFWMDDGEPASPMPLGYNAYWAFQQTTFSQEPFFSFSSGSAAGAGGPAGLGAAPNNGTPWYHNSCITSALGAGALSAGVDAIGLIPEAGGIARMIGHGSGYVGVVADRAGYSVVNAVGKSASTVQGLNGLFDRSAQGLVSDGLTVAGFIPGLGQAAAIGSIIMDTYKTAKAISQCP